MTLKADGGWISWYGGVTAIILILVDKGMALECFENNECQRRGRYAGDDTARFV